MKGIVNNFNQDVEDFWMKVESQSPQIDTWRDHREINMVMLATSALPSSFLMI